MKISKLFHWLYTILMFVPLVAILFNMVRFAFGGELELINFDTILGLVNLPTFSLLSTTIFNCYDYLISDIFGIVNYDIVAQLLTYWTSISLIYLVFDFIMYIPLMIHRWIDKAMVD